MAKLFEIQNSGSTYYNYNFILQDFFFNFADRSTFTGDMIPTVEQLFFLSVVDHVTFYIVIVVKIK